MSIPEITGEIENGSSINEIKSPFPRKWYLVIHQAAAIPKIPLMMTAKITAMVVSLMAEMVSSDVMAFRYGAIPWEKASIQTRVIGMIIMMPKNRRPIEIKTHLVILLESVDGYVECMT